MKNVIIAIGVAMLAYACSDRETGNDVTTIETQAVAVDQPFWITTQAKDEFGDIQQGSSNTSAKIAGVKDGQETKVELLNNEGLFAIALFNPGSSNFVQLPNNNFINVRVKKDDGEPFFVELFMMNNLIADTKGVVTDLMSDAGTGVKFSIDLSRASQYHNGAFVFSINKDEFFSEPEVR